MLDKKHLRSSGWAVTPLENSEHDFITELVRKYIMDLEERSDNQERLEAGVAANLRKMICLRDAEELVRTQYEQITSLKDGAEKRE